MLLVHLDSVKDGNWDIHAADNGSLIEECKGLASFYMNNGQNVLMLNPAGVGLSEGFYTPRTVKGAVEAALRFVEEKASPKCITVVGASLGGSHVAKAVEDHIFYENIEYNIVHVMTFSSVREVVASIAGKLFPFLFSDSAKECLKNVVIWCGADIDLLPAAQKIRALASAGMQIKHIVYQSTYIDRGGYEDCADDGVIPGKAALATKMIEEGIRDSDSTTIFRWQLNEGHNSSMPYYDLWSNVLV